MFGFVVLRRDASQSGKPADGFYFNFGRYHLKDVIVGKIYFLLVRIKIRHMELQIIKRESTGTGEKYLSLD